VNKVDEASGLNETRADEELVALAVAGQAEVFAHIYNRYYSRTYRLAYGMTGKREAAEDLAQEIFMRAFQKLGLFKGESSFSTWFYRLSLNHCLNHCRSERRRDRTDSWQMDRLPVPGSMKQMEKKVLQSEVQDQIHRALFSLKPKLRLVIILRDIEGLSYGEIAERIDCSTGTLAAQLKRARKLLSRKLEHLKGTF
jgi:RNA polymerase sigma-70 factor (ECF subfamily)